jgi:hypothetical protein
MVSFNYLTDEEDFVFLEDLRELNGCVIEGRSFDFTGRVL